MEKKQKNDRGFAAILILLIVIGLISIITYSVSTLIYAKKQIGKILVNSAQSYYYSESGLEDGTLRVAKGYNYSATNSFNLDINASISQNITSVNKVTTISSASTYLGNVRKLRNELMITKDNISFYYGVQVGPGGLFMNNGSAITGNLYSDGPVTGANTASITGDVFVATGMTLDHEFKVDNNSREFGEDDPIIDVAQSFRLNSPGTLSQIGLKLKRTNASPEDGTIRIVTDDPLNPGSPSKNQLAETILIASKIGTSSPDWVNYSFSNPPDLLAGVWYWIILDVSESSKYFTIAMDSNKGNGNGVSKYTENWDASNPVWTEDTGDFNYKLWIGGASTSISNINVNGDVHANTIDNVTIGGDAFGDTIMNSAITGDAHYGNITATTVGGLSINDSPADPPVQAMPISSGNITDWEAAALIKGDVFSDPAHCNPADGTVIGPAKLECDFVPQSNAVITIAGTLWVRGNVTLDNGAVLQLAPGYGSNSGVIIADYIGDTLNNGKIYLENNAKICGSSGYNGTDCNAPNGSYILMLSTYSNPVIDAIRVSNNGNGPIFYASNGSIFVLNNAFLKEATGYKLILTNNAIVTYESGLSNASFTSGPGGGWNLQSWNEIQ